MSAEFSDVEVTTREDRYVAATVSGAEPFSKTFARSKMIASNRISAHYVRWDLGPWKVAGVTVRGHRLKADGSLGADEVEKFTRSFLEDAPSWVREFAEQHMPGGES